MFNVLKSWFKSHVSGIFKTMSWGECDELFGLEVRFLGKGRDQGKGGCTKIVFNYLNRWCMEERLSSLCVILTNSHKVNFSGDWWKEIFVSAKGKTPTRPYTIWPKSSHFIILLIPFQPHSSWLLKWTPSSGSILFNIPSSSFPPLLSLAWRWHHWNICSDVTSSRGLPPLTSLSKPAPPSPPELPAELPG